MKAGAKCTALPGAYDAVKTVLSVQTYCKFKQDRHHEVRDPTLFSVEHAVGLLCMLEQPRVDNSSSQSSNLG